MADKAESAPSSAATTHETQPPKDELTQLIDLASAKEAIKDYNAAADLYSQASELQAERNGDMAVENADVLYSYGKCLYHVGVNKSDVLGTKIPTQSAAKPTTAEEPTATTTTATPTEASSSSSKQPEQSSLQDIISQSIARGKEEETGQGNAKLSEKQAINKPHFQFEGDEAFEESDDDEDAEGEDNNGSGGGGGGEDDDDDDDFANAFEILDLARVLYLRKQEELEDKKEENATELQRVKERLADTYDIQAEISLEGEKFSEAAADLRSSLKLKVDLFSAEDALIAECHYKLSLALEFASITRRQNEEGADEIVEVDYKLRDEAAEHMENAIKSCKARIEREQGKITAAEGSGEETSNHKLKREVEEVKDIVSDMEQRVSWMRLVVLCVVVECYLLIIYFSFANCVNHLSLSTHRQKRVSRAACLGKKCLRNWPEIKSRS